MPVRLDALPAGPKLTFLPLQILELLDVGAREDVHLRDRQTDDVVDPVFEVGDLALRAEVLEHVRLGHRDVDLPQIKQVVEIGSRAIGDDRNDAQIVAVVENLRQLVGEGHVGARQLAAGDADRPLVLLDPHCSIGATLLERLRHRLRLRRRKQCYSDRAETECVSEKRNDKAHAP